MTRKKQRKLSIKDFHRFMLGQFADHIRTAFKCHHIFCEADLQSVACRKIKLFLEKHEEAPGKFRLLNKPYLRECSGTYPDLVVFRRTAPWVGIELKESKTMSQTSAKKERRKLTAAKAVLHPKRAYLVYVSRYGEKRAINGPKGKKGSHYFFEVPIVLAPPMTNSQMSEWTSQFRAWSKYVVKQV